MDLKPADIFSKEGEVKENPPSTETTYRVKNIFRTVQGEGFWAGRPAVFIRLVGCNMWSGYEEDRERDAERTGADCPLWCDTDFTKEGSDDLMAEGLAGKMKEEGGEIDFCVLTGGEPFLQADAPLIETLHEAGYQVSIETNGTVPIEDAFWSEERGKAVPPDWITCSPKLPEDKLKLERFDELKLIVPDYRPSNYQDFAKRGIRHEVNGEQSRILQVQPEDGPRLEEAKRLAVEIATRNPDWRVSVQAHKMLGIE
jgi:organic radical activating enzyme